MAKHWASSSSKSVLTDQNAREVFIATLGTSPQVGTRTFDELLFKRQVPLSHVVWIHARDDTPLMQKPVARVRREVETYYKTKCPGVSFEFVTIEGRNERRPLDTRSREDAEAVLFTLHTQLGRWKARGYTVHLSISGGPKVLAAFGVAAAQLTFDSDKDKCWHLIKQDQVARRDEMHVEGDDQVHLIEVPVLRWKTWKEWASRSLAEAIAQDPLHAQDIASQLGADEMFRWRVEFVERILNEEERAILKPLALHGWENEEIDRALPGNCKNSVTRIWRSYCRFLKTKCEGSNCDHVASVSGLDEGRLRRGRLIADFHLVFQHLEARSEREAQIK